MRQLLAESSSDVYPESIPNSLYKRLFVGMHMLKNKLLLTVVAAAALSGCATQKPAPAPESADAAVIQKLNEYAERSSMTMQRLASLQIDRAGGKTVELKAPEGLDVPVSITWTGPVEQLVKKIAEITGYTYEGVLGSKPAAPVNVSISVSKMSAFQVLADAGAQAGVGADIVIRPDLKKLAVKYPPTTPTGGYVQPK